VLRTPAQAIGVLVPYGNERARADSALVYDDAGCAPCLWLSELNNSYAALQYWTPRRKLAQPW
jgi:hypothetical protein